MGQDRQPFQCFGRSLPRVINRIYASAPSGTWFCFNDRVYTPLIEAEPSARGCTSIYAVMHPLELDPAVMRRYMNPLIKAESSARGCTGMCLKAGPGMNQPQEEIMYDLVGFLVWTGDQSSEQALLRHAHVIAACPDQEAHRIIHDLLLRASTQP